jgi:hypothetical protein
MEAEQATKTSECLLAARAAAISAGDVGLAVRGEISQLMAKQVGDRQKAIQSGLAELVRRGALTSGESKELGSIYDLIFAKPSEGHAVLAKRVRSFYRALIMNEASSPTALAVASVLNSFMPAGAAGGESARAAVSTGNVVFGGTGALIGAGIGVGFGGPIGAGLGALVGAAVGVCIDEG